LSQIPSLSRGGGGLSLPAIASLLAQARRAGWG
jgi:hypothetical protein